MTTKMYYFLLVLSVLTVACQSSKPTPEKAIDEKMTAFFAAIEKQDFETAQTLVTPSTQKLLTVVMEDAKKYKDLNNKPQPIRIEIVERKIVEQAADYKIRIFVGDHPREEVIHCVHSNDIWLIDMPREQISICRYVVFFNCYDAILVIFNDHHHDVHIIKTHKKTHKQKTHKHKKGH